MNTDIFACGYVLYLFAGNSRQAEGCSPQAGSLEHPARPYGTPRQQQLQTMSRRLGENWAHLRVSKMCWRVLLSPTVAAYCLAGSVFCVRVYPNTHIEMAKIVLKERPLSYGVPLTVSSSDVAVSWLMATCILRFPCAVRCYVATGTANWRRR